jgi:hypothetical protein
MEPAVQPANETKLEKATFEAEWIGREAIQGMSPY